jgi:hypothetical protein
MEVPEMSVLHFALWLLPMPAETESSEPGMGQLLELQIVSPFKTTAAPHGPFFFESCWLLGFGDGDGACKTEGKERGFLIGSTGSFPLKKHQL